MPGGFTCACQAGFTGNGILWLPSDACQNGSHYCSINVACSSTGSGTWACDCNDGFTGNGITCVDVDECQLDIDTCDPDASCSNNAG